MALEASGWQKTGPEVKGQAGSGPLSYSSWSPSGL